MIDYWLNKRELIVIGQMYNGEKVFSICCEEYDWEVNMVIPSRYNQNETAVWGKCANPDCPEYETEQGVSHWLQEDIALHIISRSKNSPN